MKIGLLTFHSVCNFGANLQTLSTVGWLRKNKYEPVVINWIPFTLEMHDRSIVSEAQYSAHQAYARRYLPLTRCCRSSVDVEKLIKEESIESVIVGSDAVVQHKTELDRVVFPSRKILTITDKIPEYLRFPNPFWGDFLNNNRGIKSAMMSVSNQNSKFHRYSYKVKREMATQLNKFQYISVRDSWTAEMISTITKGACSPPITPDPVWSFNQNCAEHIVNRAELAKKYSLPEKYILLSFNRLNAVSANWVERFARICRSDGIECLSLPMPKGYGIKTGVLREIPLPLNPLDWYSLIKLSNGYVGNNMHPMIVSMHNMIPFFIFDHYGATIIRLVVNRKSSKIYDLLERADLKKYCHNNATIFSGAISPESVYKSITSFNLEKMKEFSERMKADYDAMMQSIMDLIINDQ